MPNQPTSTLVQEASVLIEARTGLSFDAQLRVNLGTILSELAAGDVPAFVRNLRASPDNATGWQQLMRALVIGETYFFRNRAHFQLLGDLILPDILTRRRGLNIWSAGCATGEETYSLAITLHEHLPDLGKHPVHLIGTDINNHAITAARNAVYRTWAFRQTDNIFRARYFDTVENGFHVKPFVSELATFRQANLLAGPPLPQVDVIFCCNVLLYFDEAALALVEDIMFEALNPGGWFILGQAEAIRSKRERWTTHIFPGAVVYQKPLAGAKPNLWQIGSPASLIRPAAPKTKAKTAALNPVPLSYSDAVNRFRAERYGEAQAILAEIIAQQPRNAAAHVLSACISANRGAMSEARSLLDIALQLDSLQADAHYLRGVLFLENNADSDAIEALRAALYCRRGHPLAAMILGTLYLRKGETARARRTWDEALRALVGIAPDTPVCDLSDMTAESITSFLSSQLKGL
ncbi:MAG: CheR family methyltransferase [Chloroflexota bacterium]